MKIKIPHIFYEVEILDIKKATGVGKEMLKSNFVAITEYQNHKSIIYIKLPIKPVDVPTLCHELVHVLQNICRDNKISFENEEEHTAYIFQYVLNEILGYEFK
jgi:hypothetical protein